MEERFEKPFQKPVSKLKSKKSVAKTKVLETLYYMNLISELEG